MGKRIGVTGRAELVDVEQVFSTLNQQHAETPIGLVVTTNRRGVEQVALEWAAHVGVPFAVIPITGQEYKLAPEQVYNKRLQALAWAPDEWLAFPDDHESDAFMRLARLRKVPVTTIAPRPASQRSGGSRGAA